MEPEIPPVGAQRSLYLAALLPPGNVARALFELKEELYRRYGLVSALALEPLIPLAFDAAPPAEPRRDSGDGPLVQGGTLATAGLGVAPRAAEASPAREASTEPEKAASPAGALYLDLAPGCVEWLASLRESLPRGEGLFPLRSGVFLADLAERTARGALRVRAESLPPLSLPEPLSWGVSQLACLKLRVREIGRWWGLIEQETVWSVRLRRAREGGEQPREDEPRELR